ncbi:MAG: PAS domain S-box protein, partial [Pseudomonadota bacterium]
MVLLDSPEDRVRFLTLLVENDPDLVFVQDQSFRIVYANPAFLELYPQEERNSVIGSTTVEQYDEAEAEAFLANDRKAFECGSSEVEETIHFPDGSVRVLYTKKVRYYSDSGQPLIVCVARDITALKETQRALAEQTTRYELALDGAAVGIYEYRYDNDSLHLSQRARDILGLRNTELEPQPTPSDLLVRIHADDRASVENAVRRHVQQQEVFDVECRVRRFDGQTIWVHIRGQAIWGKQGEAARIAGSVDDVTDRRLARDELMRANSELERFAFVASHDLQEPLRMVSSFSSLLAESLDEDLSDDATKYLDIIQQDAERMGTLIRDLLSYARLDTLNQASELCSLNRALSEAQSHLAGAVADTGATIHTTDLPDVRLDAGRAVSLLQNLIGNAIKYRHPNRTPEIHITAKTHDDHYEIRVSDNGVGIKAAYLDQIFEPFKRLSRDRPGTGMGLAICRRILLQAGGALAAESVYGEGTTLTAKLPRG